MCFGLCLALSTMLMTKSAAILGLALTLAASLPGPAAAQTTNPTPTPAAPAQVSQAPQFPPASPPDPAAESDGFPSALARLPLAAVLGAALALRPRRRGTPPRTTAVVQTQIVLAVVGATIMLVVGASLARAFAIVGAANLIRYRSKIEDPKDAVVMLSTLVVGLAAGVGLYRLALFSTAFLVVALWIIESFEPKQMKTFTLSVKAGDKSDELRKSVEAVLRRHHLRWELRTLANEEVAFQVQIPADMRTDAVAKEIAALDAPEGNISVEWDEQMKKGK